MSGQNAERSDEPVSADSRLDAILEQLNALGGSASSTRSQDRPLQSVPTPVAIVPALPEIEPVDVQSNVPEHPEPHDVTPVPNLELVPPPVDPVATTQPAVAAEYSAPAEQSAELVPPPIRDVAPVELVPPPVAPPPVAPAHVETVVAAPEPASDASFLIETVEVSEDVDEQSLVFELEPDFETESVPTPTPTPPPVPADADTGWVSHESSPSIEDVEPNGESPFDEPDWSDLVEEGTEPVGEVAADFEMTDLATTMPMAQEALLVEATGSVLDDEPIVAVEPDEPLPELDFTGVWADTTEPTVWDNELSEIGDLPDPIEGNRYAGGVSVGRNDLDSLRPADEQSAVSSERNLSRKLQFLAVMLFGLIALAVVLLNDPRAVEELREIYDGFVG